MKNQVKLQAHHKLGMALLAAGLLLGATSLALQDKFGDVLFIAGLVVLLAGLVLLGFDPFIW